MPRYFVAQNYKDTIVFDLLQDRFLWKADTILDLSLPDCGAPASDGVVDLQLPPPTEDGFAPRGPKRDWRFDASLVLPALVFLISASWMASKGFHRFASRLDAALKSGKSSRRHQPVSFSEIAGAIEWARLLSPFKAKCLPISIATVRLARTFGIDAKVVVGVHALPLQSHAWAQVNECLINDFLDRVGSFQPIFCLPVPAS